MVSTARTPSPHSLASWVDAEWFPTELRTNKQYWSYHFGVLREAHVIVGTTVTYSCFHVVALQRMYAAFLGWRMGGVSVVDYSSALVVLACLMDLLSLLYLLMMRNCGLVKPLAQQVVHVALVQLVVLFRFVHLGKVLAPFRHIILSVQSALPYIVRLGMVTLVVLFGVAGAQVKLRHAAAVLPTKVGRAVFVHEHARCACVFAEHGLWRPIDR